MKILDEVAKNPFEVSSAGQLCLIDVPQGTTVPQTDILRLVTEAQVRGLFGAQRITLWKLPWTDEKRFAEAMGRLTRDHPDLVVTFRDTTSQEQPPTADRMRKLRFPENFTTCRIYFTADQKSADIEGKLLPGCHEGIVRIGSEENVLEYQICQDFDWGDDFKKCLQEVYEQYPHIWIRFYTDQETEVFG